METTLQAVEGKRVTPLEERVAQIRDRARAAGKIAPESAPRRGEVRDDDGWAGRRDLN